MYFILLQQAVKVTNQKQRVELPIICVKMTSVMGITWILGYIASFEVLSFLEYLHVILNSLQGGFEINNYSSFIHLFIYSFIHSFIHSFFSFIHSFVRLFIDSFIHSFSQSDSQSISQSVNQSISQSVSQSVQSFKTKTFYFLASFAISVGF